MKVIEKGPGRPEVAVVAAVHGDEPCGEKAIERFLNKDFDLQKGVKLVIANEEALEKGERFIDTDLNRCFPGNIESELHEEVLAAQLMEELEGTKSILLHSMKGFEEIFALVNKFDKSLVSATGVEKVVDVRPLDEESIEKYLEAVSVETGKRGSEQASDNSYQVMLNFLTYFGVIDGEINDVSPELYEMYEEVSGDYEFLAENFEKVEKGDKFAENQEEELRAEEAFYPILMSSDGYEDILGFKGRRPENELKGER